MIALEWTSNYSDQVLLEGLILDHPPGNPAKLDCIRRRMKMPAITSSY
jgi:hypothetical protein